jgi:hypothetical protein
MKSLAKGMLIGQWLGGAYAAARGSYQAPVVAPRYKVPMNARGVPPRGSSSSTAPPAAGAESGTSSPARGSQSSTKPPAPGSTSASSEQRGLPAPRVRDTAAANRWLRSQLNVIRDPANPNRLRFLLEPNPKAGGKLDWRTTERKTKAGDTQTGRYEGNETGPTIQIGHQGAFAGGAPEQFMIEDADLNQLGGNVIESKGTKADPSKGTKAEPVSSYKEAVLIDGVPVDVASAQQWERLGLLPPGTVDSSPRILPPVPVSPAK